MAKITTQLESWTNKFGRNYTKRNTLSSDELDKLYRRVYGITMTRLNKIFLDRIDRSSRILEVGTNTGNQLLALKEMGFKNLYGIEPQEYAVKIAKKRIREAKIMKADTFNIPFDDGYFDMVFTAGVLIHVSPADIKMVLKEIHRCSRSFIWGYEYYSKEYEEIEYYGKKNLLWKANFSKLYLDLFDDLKLVKEKHLKYLYNNNIDTMFLLKKVENAF